MATTVEEQRVQLDRARLAACAAEEIDRFLSRVPREQQEIKILFDSGPSQLRVTVPREAAERLVEVLKSLGTGRQPSVVPSARELSTGDVADLIGVSRQYIVRLLDAGRLPYRRVGNRRRVLLADALAYLRTDDRLRANRFQELVAREPEPESA